MVKKGLVRFNSSKYHLSSPSGFKVRLPGMQKVGLNMSPSQFPVQRDIAGHV